MKPLIAIVDYEMGNLHSVSKALEKAGARVQITSSPAVIRKAAGVVLPGVGAFGEAIKRLSSKRLSAPVTEALEKNKPFLGICLGLQLLFDRSEESPRAKGLGFIKGDVVRFFGKPSPRRKSGPSALGTGFRRYDDLKVPHMGWNTLQRGPAARTRVLSGVSDGGYFYFVHSFFAAPKDLSLVATRTIYGRPFCSSIAQERLYACQFHPEKSGDEGEHLLRNFVNEVTRCS